VRKRAHTHTHAHAHAHTHLPLELGHTLSATRLKLRLHFFLFAVLKLPELLVLGIPFLCQLVLTLSLGAPQLRGALALRALHCCLHRLLQLILELRQLVLLCLVVLFAQRREALVELGFVQLFLLA
jgi:hypothetical protein